MRRILLCCALAILVTSCIAKADIFLTSITLDPETAAGVTTNAPGAWSTNAADPLLQFGVASGGTFLNNPGIYAGSTFDLGEISIALAPGVNTFDLYADTLALGNAYYGAILFFDFATLPPAAVYNSNGGTGAFQVQAAGNNLICSANGGSFFCPAPGSSVYIAPDGSSVKVLGFTIDSQTPGTDLVKPIDIGPDGHPDTTAHLTLLYSPVPEPSAWLLLASMAGALGLLRRRR